MGREFWNAVEENPIIAAVKSMDDLEQCCRLEDIRVVFILFGDICSIGDIVKKIKAAGKIAMVIAPNSLPTYIADGGNEVNYGVASIPSNTGESVSAGVMDRFMCFDNDYTDEEKAAITTFFDYFYDDERYTDWVAMEGFLPATKTGGEALAASDPDMASWIDILGNCKFYPTAKAEWADVKQGVISAEQNALLGESVQEQLDNLQAEIAG